MSGEGRMLTRQQAKVFYDRLGAKQDWQAFYEVPVINNLIAHAALEQVQSVFEFGCGTGAFAERVLSHHLSPRVRYLAVDSSSTMVALARTRLARFGERVTIQQTSGSLQLDAPDGTFDCFVSTYVVDLLPAADIVALLSQAHRLLTPDGRLCLVSLTFGRTRLTRLVIWGWRHLHTLRPSLVGGCRPVELLDFLPETHWRLDYAQTMTACGVPSEVVVASRTVERGRGLLSE